MANEAPNHEANDSTNSAHVSVYVEPTEADYTYPMVIPTADEVSVLDLGEFVCDRIEANGKVTLPDDDDLPAPGERAELGTVYWNEETGIPTRLELDGRIVYFTESGGVDRVEEVATDGGRHEERGTLRGRCDDCGEVGEATVEVDTWSGVAAWSCPQCGHTQEPPRPVEGGDC